MAIKPFEIQSSTLTIGGVDLQAGATSVVIPGVTQATNYRVEEVEDTGDQTYQFAPNSAVVVIDKALYDTIVAEGNVSTFADFSVELDDDGYIDDIEVNGQGTYSSANADRASLNDMYAYVGTGSASNRPLDPQDWIQIPFRPKMRAGEVETIGGGSGGAIVERSVSFPNGEEGDTRGTIALTPDGETYVCTDDWVDASESLQGTFTAVTNELYDINQGGGFNSASLSIQDEPEIYNILRYGNWSEGELTIDAGPTWGGVQNVVNTGYNDQAGYMTLLWLYRQGDPQEIPLGTSVTITYTGSGNQTPIWRRLVDLTAQGGGEDGEINWRSNGDLTIETIRTNGYTGDCDLNLYGADDVWIEAKGDELELRAVSTVSIQVQGNGSWIFQQDGSIALPDLENTGWENGYTLNAPTLMLGGELNNPPQQVVITGPRPNVNNTSAERLIIQGQKGWGGENEPKGEGGDIYLWAGVGGDGGSIGSQGNGGDIKVRGGQGGAGGYVKVEGGDATGPGGTGGYIEITAGDGTNVTSGDGGDVRIKAGSGSGTGNNGEINLYTVGTTNQWIFKNDGALQLPVGGDIRDSNGVSVLGGGTGGAQLVGDGYSAGTGYKRTVYTNFDGYQGGESTSVLFNKADLLGETFAIGDTITFRNGEVRTITSYDDTYNENTQVAVGWDTNVEGGDLNPRYPITLTTSNYVAETKLTARIKPDSMLVGSGQYMEVYAGGPTVLEQKHIHMAGANADTELFLGTDNNFVSAKEAGLSPARVNLKSENDITVTDTNLRMTRGSTWVNVYGDGQNRDWRNNVGDLTWNVVESDDQGNFYVGGENESWADAMVAKYGPDGDLIWKKIVNGDNISGWQLDGIAYNPVDKEIGVAVQTNYQRSHDYYKLTVLDSETGDVKSSLDIYDPDGNIDIYNMAWNPTLGYVAVGRTYGEKISTNSINSSEVTYNLTTATTEGSVGYVTITDNGNLPSVVPQAGDKFDFNSQTFTITSVNAQATYYELAVSGNSFGYGAGQPVVLRHSKSGTGVIELPIADVTINGSLPVGDSNWTINGTNITNQTIQSGSIGLYRNCPVINLTNPSATGLEVGIQVIYGGSPYYSNHSTQVAGTGYSFGDSFKILGSYLGGVDGVNDITGTIIDDSNIANGFSGTPAATTWRLDAGWGMGYGSTDFSFGTFTITSVLDSRAFVWTDAWSMIYNPSNTSSTSIAYSVATSKITNDIVVGGYDNGASKGFVWKLDNTGTTQWIYGPDGDGVYSVAVSEVTGEIYFTTNYDSLNKMTANGTLLKRIEPNGSWGQDSPIVKLRQELDGTEYLYVGGTFGAMWSGQTGYMISKFNSNLDTIWSRDIWNNDRSLNSHYDVFHNNFALGRDNAVLVGYSYLGSPDYYNGYLASMSILDDFTSLENVNNWNLENTGSYVNYTDQTGNYTLYDFLDNGGTAATGSMTTEGGNDSNTWLNWTWQSLTVRLETTDNGIVGVESIQFADGGKLDHNPSDIPPVFTDFSQVGWNYTLKLSDRGKFITNGQGIENYTNDLFITVPKNSDLSFPVGSVITLINLSDTGTNNNYIYVQPDNFGNDDCPRIYATGFGTTWSTWSFPGIQTATLMKIGSNDWLLTANNIQNED